MITQILAHPQRVRRCTGLDFDQFQNLSLRLKPLWEKEEIARLTLRPRKNLIGQGHPYTLKTIDEKLLTVLMYYKLYPAYWFLGLVVNLDAGNICRLMTKMREILQKGADPSLDQGLKSALDKLLTEFEEKKRLKKKISSWEQLKQEDPKLYQIWSEVFVDATEQQRLRPGRKHGRRVQKRIERKTYSGKKKRHTLKTQIMVNSQGQILTVSRTYPGSVHDYTVFKAEQTVKHLPKEIKTSLDKGYDGIKKDYPDLKVNIPVKKNRWKKFLTRSELLHNHKLSRKRILIEHILSRMKKYKVLAEVFRSKIQHYNQDFRNIAALINFRLSYNSS